MISSLLSHPHSLTVVLPHFCDTSHSNLKYLVVTPHIIEGVGLCVCVGEREKQRDSELIAGGLVWFCGCVLYCVGNFLLSHVSLCQKLKALELWPSFSAKPVGLLGR